MYDAPKYFSFQLTTTFILKCENSSSQMKNHINDKKYSALHVLSTYFIVVNAK